MSTFHHQRLHKKASVSRYFTREAAPARASVCHSLNTPPDLCPRNLLFALSKAASKSLLFQNLQLSPLVV